MGINQVLHCGFFLSVIFTWKSWISDKMKVNEYFPYCICAYSSIDEHLLLHCICAYTRIKDNLTSMSTIQVHACFASWDPIRMKR